MSRLAKQPIILSEGVSVKISGQEIVVKGKLGELSLNLIPEITVKQEENTLLVETKGDTRFSFNMWGTSHSLIGNMIEGVSSGFLKKLELKGVGYRAAVQGKDLVLQLGFSHEVRYPIPAELEIKCEKPTLISISGIDKQLVGQVASEIRGFRPPEPYKGKGVMYEGENVRRKEGKKK